MSGAKTYEDSVRRNGVDAVHLAMRQLREHWDAVTITVNRTDAEGNDQAYELDHTPEEDDEDKKV
jgi:hypothetical protein